MESYRAEDIVQRRRYQRRTENETTRRRELEIAYYFVYATVPAAARKLERLNFPTEGSTYRTISEDLIVPGDSRSRIGWFLGKFTWRGDDWNLYILQNGVLLMQNANQPHNTRIIRRDNVRRYVKRIEELVGILERLRRLAGILVSHRLKLQLLDYPGFWFCTY